MQKTQEKQLHIVMPASLFEKLRRVAERDQRSLNKQVVYLLQRSLEKENDEPTQPAA